MSAERRLTDAIEAGKAQRPGARGDRRLDWWREARFGAFIHWGLYALPDRWAAAYPATIDHHWTQEWVQHVRRIPRDIYAQAAVGFHAAKFDPAAWARLFRDAGQRYVVLTAKHHDGFCLFSTATTPFNSVEATPCGHDVVGELAAACRAEGLRFGVYYSQTQDWHHPDGHGNDWDFDPARKDFAHYLEHYVKPQLDELLTNYGELAILWFDTPMIMTAEQSADLRAFVHERQPDCLVCGRIGNGLGDYATTRDNQYLRADVGMDWECPATMNNTWGFRASDQSWKSVDELRENLLVVWRTGGNYLLNVGPDGDGVIPDPSAARLRALGAWLREHPEVRETGRA